MTTYAISLETASFEAYSAIKKLDKSYVGTENYLGVAYFWDHEIKHWMRDATIAKRKKIHELLLKAGESPVEDVKFPESNYFETNDKLRAIVEKVLKIKVVFSS